MKSLVAHAHAPAAWGFRRRPGTRLDLFRGLATFLSLLSPEQEPAQGARGELFLFLPGLAGPGRRCVWLPGPLKQPAPPPPACGPLHYV